MTALADGQMQLGTTGPLMGEGTIYHIVDLDGFARTIKERDYERPAADGSVLGPEFSESRTITITFRIEGSTTAQVMQRYDALALEWNRHRYMENRIIDAGPLRWKLPGQVTRRLNGRPRRFEPVLSTIASGYMMVVATFYAADPRMYADTLRSVVLDYGAGSVTLPNDGNHPAPVVWNFYPNATNPSVTRVVDGRTMTLTTALSNQQKLDTDARTVTVVADGSNNYSAFTGVFLEVPTGGGDFYASATSGVSGAYNKITADYRDTWMV